jgi:transcriptional regulator with XRE-family HTH domain
MIIFSSQIRAARGLLKISQLDLALESGVSIQTIKNYEDSDTKIRKGSLETIDKIRSAFEQKGVKFVCSKEGDKITNIGVRLNLS